ncbi:ferritin-like domain-containing protein [Pedobacter cryotolerans]|uniref:Ferritin-like domain-containing protein n=1 Tax=Pedobacter cryotolerans TaxID=2571270 RepID=A0A4U1BWW1_9SPHI|nr:ferritin-like domain-containing protein [Pedobacter cryotolerans]TKB97111.1 ferritin-like domain-containing protein [Pedobacter cryotolerans]
MNIINILDEIEKVDGEIYERLSPRRKAMKDFFNVGKKVSLAALPLALGSMFQKAYGQTNPTSVTEVLNFALALEYLEYNYYNHALTNSTIVFPNAASRTAIETIRGHERAHVDLLKGALNITGADAYVDADFDFTGAATFGTAFADVFSNYATFLKVAIAFEDTGVRAYKGQAGVLKQNAVLTTALQIHSVEARHAAHVRQMAAAAGIPLKPWIAYAANGNDTGIAQVNAVYAGEQSTMQAGVEITGINGTAVTQTHAAECFDEILNGTTVKTIANIFIRTKKLA